MARREALLCSHTVEADSFTTERICTTERGSVQPSEDLQKTKSFLVFS